MEIQETRQGAVTVVRPQGPLADWGTRSSSRALWTMPCGEASGGSWWTRAPSPTSIAGGLKSSWTRPTLFAKTGRACHVCCVNETIREVLHMTGLADRFEHFEDVNSRSGASCSTIHLDQRLSDSLRWETRPSNPAPVKPHESEWAMCSPSSTANSRRSNSTRRSSSRPIPTSGRTAR